MLKAQDIVLLLKLIATSTDPMLSQNQLATYLCFSVSEVNAGFKRLHASGLLQPGLEKHSHQLIQPAITEFLLFAVKYVFPAKLGEYTRGIPTSYAAPILQQYIESGSGPVPIWPFAEGNTRGVALAPLYSSVPLSITRYPDQCFYELLVLVDAIRQGRVRERQIATKLLKEKLRW